MTAELFSNRFKARALNCTRPVSSGRSLTLVSRPLTGSLSVVANGTMMDPFFRGPSERPGRSSRDRHLGVDITGPRSGNRSLDDPRRGAPVYAAIRSSLSLDDLNRVRAFNKRTNASLDGLSIAGSGQATLTGAKIHLQHWSSREDHSYGGNVGMSCVYSYGTSSGGNAEFTLFVEFLHLITREFLPKDAAGRIASFEEWQDLGRGIGFGPNLVNNGMVGPEFFSSDLQLVGYLGATQTPHVHIQTGFFNSRSFSLNSQVRLDPMVVVY